MSYILCPFHPNKVLKSDELFRILYHGRRNGEKYPPKVRHFCLGLVCYSMRAYSFIRKTFNNHLPGVKTVKNWFANSDIRGEPGMQDDHIERLKRIAEDYKEKSGREIICSLVFDEMNMRQQECFSLHQLDYVGYVTYGDDPQKETKTIAKQAIVFMLKGINVNFEYPISYYLIASLKYDQRAKLLTDVISTVSRCGIRIFNITFDGYGSNVPMCVKLGANLDVYSKDFKPYIMNPITNERIYVYLDPCHMEKLTRNRLATVKTFIDRNSNKIEWRYIEALHEYTLSNGLHTHKITKRHMQWKRIEMNVRVAVETFSESVASSIEHLMNLGIPQFQGAQPTIDFIRRMNTLFDIFNSIDSKNDNIFKRVMSAENKRLIFTFLKDTIHFFKTLKVETTHYVKRKGEKKAIKQTKLVQIINTRHKCAFRGFIIDMESIMMSFMEYVEEKKLLVNIPTYNLLQDVIEMLFCRIRSCGGFNNNPNAHQLKGAFRKILANMKLDLSEHSNCRVIDMNLPDNMFYSNIYFVSSRRAKVTMDQNLYDQQKDRILDEFEDTDDMEYNERAAIREFEVEDFEDNHNALIDSSNFLLEYIASSIEMKILSSKSFHCDSCRYIFYENEIADSTFLHSSKKTPCVSTVQICRVADRFFKLYDIEEKNPKYDFKVLYCLIFRTMNFDDLYSNSKFECSHTHKYQFIKCIVGLFISIRARHIAKQLTLGRHEKILRQQCNHLVLNRGQ